MTLDARRLFYAFSLALVCSMAGIAYGLYWADSQLSAREAQIDGLHVEVDNLDKQIINARTLSAQLEGQQDIQEIADDVLPELKTQENIIGEMIAIASERNIELQNFNFSGGSGQNVQISQAEAVDGIPGVLGLSFTTAFETSYENTIDFLVAIENNKRRFEVTSLDITPIVDDNGRVVSYGAQIAIVTYVRP